MHISAESIRNGETTQISLPHTVASGPVQNEDYGLDLARRFLPARVVDNAEQICRFLRDRQARKSPGPTTRALKQNKLVLALPGLLKQAFNSTMDDSALASYLKKLQTEFTIRMNIVADDDAQTRDGNRDDEPAVDHPVIEKPGEQELEEWKKKCDAAERRVMHANMLHSQQRKRPALEEIDGEPGKRNKRDGNPESVPRPTPINRSSIIEELRRETSMPSNREDTPSSLTMDVSDPVMGETPDLDGDKPPTDTFKLPLGVGRESVRAVSISSRASSYEDAVENMPGNCPSSEEAGENRE